MSIELFTRKPIFFVLPSNLFENNSYKITLQLRILLRRAVAVGLVLNKIINYTNET